MPVQNVEISAVLTRLADLLEIEGENPFRIRAYRNAARLIETHSRSLARMLAQGEDLTELPGIGDALAKKIKEIVDTGRLAALEKEQGKLPQELTQLLDIPGIGPKRVHILFEQLKIKDRDDLLRAARRGIIREVPGFGAKTETRIREYLATRHATAARVPISVAEQLVRPLIDSLQSVPGVNAVTPAGSYRRRVETVGDVDLLVSCERGEEVARRFVDHEDVAQVLAHGDTRSAVVLRSGLHVDFRVVPPSSYGAALHYFTGSKTHNIAIRSRGVKAGLRINEYGIFRGRKQIGGTREEDVFDAVGLPWIPPELRENSGEIEAAERGRIPRLVEMADLRGDLQCHTTASDGHDTLEAMAAAAQRKGYEYLAITDHSKRVAVAHGLNATRLARQIRQIDALNARLKNFRILKSVEVDILEDGSLDLSDDILKELDLVVAAVHFRPNLSASKQTERMIRAMDNPLVHILAHPTGRLINERPPMELDMEKILVAARDRGCCAEANAQPSRLDINDTYCRMAKEIGTRVAISTDAHSPAEFDFMPLGVNQARRGWLEASDVVNTRSWEDLSNLLKRT